MAMEFSGSSEGTESAEFEVRQGGRGRPVDLLVGTPNKMLEMARGRGWNWEEKEREKERERLERGVAGEGIKDRTQPFWTAWPELGLAGIEWVVVDEADVLFGK
jgi:ATP-dependent RNA helicase MRH4